MTLTPDDARPAAATSADVAAALAVPTIVAGQASPSPDSAVINYETVAPPPFASQVENGPSLTRRARDGAIWSIAGTVLMLGTTLLAQVIVGNLLQAEYALNTVLITVTLIAGLLRDAGVRKMAVASGPNYPNVARQLQQLSWILNLLIAAVLAVATPLIADRAFAQPHPELRRLLWILAFTFAAGPAWMMQWATLTLELRFRALTLASLCSYLLRNLSLILFAKFGATQLALVMPLLISSTFESIAGRVLGGPLPRGPNLTRRTAVTALMTSRWIMLGLFGSILTTRADTFFIGKLGGFDFDTTVAAYGFASLLAFSALTPFTQAVQTTLTPIFVRLVGEPERIGNAFQRVVGVCAVVGTAAWLPAMFVSAPTMHLLWPSKPLAIPVVIALLCMLIPKCLQTAALALDEAAGRFRRAALLVLVDGVTTVAVTFAIALHGNAVLLAAAVSAHHVVYCAYHVLTVGRRACAHDPRASLHILERMFGPTLVGLASLGATLVLVRVTTGHWLVGTSPLGFVWGAVSSLIFLAGIRFLQPARFNETLDLILRRGNAR